MNSQRILGPAVDISECRSDSPGAYYHAFKNCVGVTLKNRSVHECSGIDFISIADYVFLISLIRGCEGPFQTGWESGTPPPSQARILDGLDYLEGGHFRKSLSYTLIASSILVVLYRFRIYCTAVAKYDSLLKIKEITLRTAGVPIRPTCINKIIIIYYFVTENVLTEDLLCRFRGYSTVEYPAVPFSYFNQWFSVAHTDAACSGEHANIRVSCRQHRKSVVSRLSSSG